MARWPLIDELPVAWRRSVWEDGDVEGAPIDYYMEFDADGVVLRQIELADADQTPIAAASLAEFWAAQGGMRQAATVQLLEYQARFGSTAEGTRDEWSDDFPGADITREEFDTVWHRARHYLRQLDR